MVVARRAPGRCGRLVRLVLIAALTVTAGCGGSQPAPHNPALGLDLVRHAGDGPSVAVLPRATGNLVRLSLWLDAGSRDAQPPQVATLAGWLAAEAAGPDVRAGRAGGTRARAVVPEGRARAVLRPTAAGSFAAGAGRASAGRCANASGRRAASGGSGGSGARRGSTRVAGALWRGR